MEANEPVVVADEGHRPRFEKLKDKCKVLKNWRQAPNVF
jgi:hypothetical protein